MTVSNVLVDNVALISIDEVTPWDNNPRLGNTAAIAESLEKNKQYRPIVVQKSSMKVLAGNHTWRAAKHLGWEEISIVVIDVNDEAAQRIVLADNRTADLGTYDATILAAILEELPDVEGTGYSENDKQLLLDSVADHATPEEVFEDIIRPPAVVVRNNEEELQIERQEEATSGGAVGGMIRPDLTDEDEGLQQFDDFEGELRGLLQLREDVIWPSSNDFGIPSLRPDMLISDDDFDNLTTWVSRKLTEDDGEQQFIFNYNLGSSVAIPYDRTMLGFYTHDEKFEGWWALPANYTTKALNAGIKYAMVPDFSLAATIDDRVGNPPVINALNVYRAMWMGRFFQEAGIKVMPDLRWSNQKENDWFVKYANTPVGMPAAITQIQTMNADDEVAVRFHEEGLEWAIETAKPQVLYAYVGEPGAKLVERIAEKTEHKPEVRIVWSYSKIKNDDKKNREEANKEEGETGLFTGDKKLDRDRVEEIKSMQSNIDGRVLGQKVDDVISLDTEDDQE